MLVSIVKYQGQNYQASGDDLELNSIQLPSNQR